MDPKNLLAEEKKLTLLIPPENTLKDVKHLLNFPEENLIVNLLSPQRWKTLLLICGPLMEKEFQPLWKLNSRVLFKSLELNSKIDLVLEKELSKSMSNSRMDPINQSQSETLHLMSKCLSLLPLPPLSDSLLNKFTVPSIMEELSKLWEFLVLNRKEFLKKNNLVRLL